MNAKIGRGTGGRQPLAPVLRDRGRGREVVSRGETLMAGEILAFLHRHNRATLLMVGAASLWGLLAL